LTWYIGYVGGGLALPRFSGVVAAVFGLAMLTGRTAGGAFFASLRPSGSSRWPLLVTCLGFPILLGDFRGHQRLLATVLSASSPLPLNL
jgi:hypothetical protein